MTINRWAARLPGRSWLKRHVADLQVSLNAMLRRLRDELSHTVARAVSEAVREAVQHLSGKAVSESTVHRSETFSRTWPEQSRRSTPDYWSEDEPADRWDEEDREWNEPETLAREPSAEPEVASAPRSRWPTAVAAGCRAAAWWLGKSRRNSLLESTVVAIVAALGSAWVGPALVTGAAGLCLGLFGLIEGIGSATAALNH